MQDQIRRGSADDQQARGRRAFVDLILTTEEDFSRFVVTTTEHFPACPRLQLTPKLLSAATLGEMVESGAREQYGIDVRHIGVASVSITTDVHQMVCVAQLSAPLERQSHRRHSLRVLGLEYLRETSPAIEHFEHFELAQERALAEHSAATIGPLIQKAYQTSLSFLRAGRSQEGNRSGWSQFLDQRTIGLISTSQGALSHLYAGERPEFVPEATDTLVDMQNPDGGWQVRRALIGGSSDMSITESTCYCILALTETGKPTATNSVTRGAQWLIKEQHADGWFSSSAHTKEPQVVATSLAVRALMAAGESEAARRGAEWLRSQQHDDGGWAQGARTPHSATSPAYTAHALIALLVSGRADATQPATAVTQGCLHLEATFDASKPEPWSPIAVNMVVDDSTAVRLEFKHFSTALALTALALAGYDMSNRIVLSATKKLLDLQQIDGSWRCALVASGANTIWAMHDALLALRTVTQSTSMNITVLAKSGHEARERSVLQDAILKSMLTDTAHARQRRLRGWLQTSWLSALTIVVLLLVASQFGLFEKLASDSGLQQVAAIVATALLALAGALLPPILAEEYKIRRSRQK